MKKEQLTWLQLVLTFPSIAIGSALHGTGHVGFWGMLVIMMLPNFAFMLMRLMHRRSTKQSC
ncbi:hypothetical protein F9C43_26000 [Pseudomonas aeruginosa]|nr:hypothetical protein PA1S_21320 [Pseudomonas aeruginosa PA1]ALE49940.1 hypothetical protein AOD73_21310 [Pseudomonas aeruginosa]QII96712.1 hypothetical protein F9C43_26000 [Pseudomonas aeruginosa]VCY58207.1 hypothetical protein BANRA_04090 [Pseudomonas aeruginosa]